MKQQKLCTRGKSCRRRFEDECGREGKAVKPRKARASRSTSKRREASPAADAEPFEATLSEAGWDTRGIEDVLDGRVWVLHQQGVKQRDIAQGVGKSLSTVNRIIQRGWRRSHDPYSIAPTSIYFVSCFIP